ncbi:MAG TPA: trehalose-phosphatase [Steroidobacteraceae bacterium]|nr:trehalose-phosphatase [Steroidobacteraceae bacterium]
MQLDPPPNLSAAALFVDVDGTLLEIAPTPHAVRVEPELTALLRSLLLATSGALALVSGRSIAELDALFLPLTLPAAGLHGFERRGASGSYECRRLPPAPALEQARRALLELADQHPGLLVEDKRFSLAMHYRRAPHLGSVVVRAMTDIAAGVRPEFELQMGKMVAELRPAGSTKGAAVAEFMTEHPYRGRLPIYIGDDLTDESAFEWVNGVGGLSIAVNVSGATAARERLPDVTAVRAWLAQARGPSSLNR